MQIPITLLGHKDHGKSTLIGRLLLDSGSVKEDKIREIQAIDREMGKTFELAHILDSFREERQNEMTMDTTLAHLKGRKGIYELIDVPGHRELIQNMLTGASNAKLAVLVISAKEGIREQTIQHVSLASLLGIKDLIVAVNKMDEVAYSREVFDQIKNKIQPVVKENSFAHVYYVPISARGGDNVVKRSRKLKWYHGKSVLEYLEDACYQDNRSNEPLRIPIQDVYEDGVRFIVGRVESGTLREKERVRVFPANIITKVNEVFVGGSRVKRAEFWQNVGVILEKKKFRVKRGMVICDVRNVPSVTKRVKLLAVLVRHPRGRQLVLECGTQERNIQAAAFSGKSVGKKVIVDISFDSPLVSDTVFDSPFKKCVLKEGGRIIGVGTFF